jgi:hypothetical protein
MESSWGGRGYNNHPKKLGLDTSAPGLTFLSACWIGEQGLQFFLPLLDRFLHKHG